MTDGLQTAPRPFPLAVDLTGRSVRLEAVVDERRFSELFDALGDPAFDAIWDYMSIGPFRDRTSFETAARSLMLGEGARFFAIVPTGSGRAEGYLSLMRVDTANGVIEIGNIVLGPTLQRTRAASEAYLLVFRFVFEALGYRRLEWKCNDLNAPSKRAAERLGFSYEGLFRQHMIVKGRSRDTAWFSMLDREWPAVRRAFETYLDDRNFDGDGRQRHALAARRS